MGSIPMFSIFSTFRNSWLLKLNEIDIKGIKRLIPNKSDNAPRKNSKITNGTDFLCFPII